MRAQGSGSAVQISLSWGNTRARAIFYVNGTNELGINDIQIINIFLRQGRYKIIILAPTYKIFITVPDLIKLGGGKGFANKLNIAARVSLFRLIGPR